MTSHDVDKLRPNGKARPIRVRSEPMERDAFERAAKLSGITLSAWVRHACREASARQFVNAGIKVPWL